MSKIFFIFIFFLGFFLDAYAQDKNQFSSDELKEIRNVSRAILTTRGQQRKAAIAESEEIRADVEELKKVLRQEQTSLEAPVLKLDSTANSVQLTPEATVVAAEDNVALGDKVTRKIKNWLSRGEAREKTIKSAKIKRARAILAARRNAIEKELPALWEVWKEKDPHKSRIRERLEKLDAELAGMEELEPQQRHKAVTDMLERLEPKVDKSEPDPTITSITRHIKKQAD